MKKQGKRITALTVSAMLMLNMAATAVPVSAEGESKVYTHDGYTVEYTVKNEWTGNQNIEVTITNTGDDVLSGWAMGYNAFGEIGGLWNAKVYGHQGTEYILSSAGYNDELAPGQSTNFGYTLTGDKFKIPQNIVNCAERVDITEGYNVYYNITDDFVDTYQAEMIIENTSDTDISAWQLSFDGNVTINDLWNGKLIENSNGSFKVKNSENNSVIAAGSSVSFNFGGTKNTESEPNLGYSEPVETLPPVPVVTDEFTEAETAAESAETDAANPENDPAETEIPLETVLPEITTVTEPVIMPVSEVVFSNYKLTGMVIPMEFDFEIDPEVDSDNDGLPDYLEKELGTDRYNADTDGDGLPDGYEYFTLGTDPKKADSDDNGISDADEDFDEDGLTNLEEYELGTDPFSKDTDNDGLSDYDEVKIHNTDPLKYDTDGDKVSDGDEVILGLDPNNPATFGYPDNEYTTVQTVGEGSSALDYINNIEDNPYSVTIEITAAGVADNNLTAGESGYSYSILQNDAVLGVVPEFDYSDGLSVTDVVIKFKIDDSAVDNKLGVYADEPEFNGINRLQVFKYFEDNNILLPIETFYDEETKTVYTHVDELGTYCLMDMEMWINYLENLEPGNYYEEDDTDPANIVFCIDTRDIIDEESFENTKSDIEAVIKSSFERYSKVKVYIYYQQFGSNFRIKNNLLTDSKTGNNYFTSYEEAEKFLDNLERYMIKSNYWAYDLVEATQFMIDTCDENTIAMYHITANDRVMGSIDDAKKLIQTVKNSAYTNDKGETAYRINVSILCPNGDISSDSYAYELANASYGMVYSNVNYESQVMTLNALANNAEESSNNVSKSTMAIDENLIKIYGMGNTFYRVVSSSGLTVIKLDEVLTENSTTDTDDDGIYDWDEVDTEQIFRLMAKNDPSNQYFRSTIYSGALPKISDCVWYSSNSQSDEENGRKEFLDNGYKIALNKYIATHYGIDEESVKAEFDTIRVLPIHSNPANPDSDGDKIPDCIKFYDTEEYKNHKSDYYVTEFDDPNPLKFEYLWQWPVVIEDAVESYYDKTGELKYRSKIDEKGQKFVFNELYKYKRLQASFDEIRGGNKPHRAIDITIDKNEYAYVAEPEKVKHYVIAAYSGTVVYTYDQCKSYNDVNHQCGCNKYSGYGGYGNCIEIKSNINGVKFKTLYAHLNPDGLLVQNGAHVSAGDVIAIVGSSGSSSGRHLDFSIIEGDGDHSYGPYVDPVLFNSYYKSENTTNWNKFLKTYDFLINVPRNIQYTCDDKCNGCISYEKEIDTMYKLN